MILVLGHTFDKDIQLWFSYLEPERGVRISFYVSTRRLFISCLCTLLLPHCKNIHQTEVSNNMVYGNHKCKVTQCLLLAPEVQLGHCYKSRDSSAIDSFLPLLWPGNTRALTRLLSSSSSYVTNRTVFSKGATDLHLESVEAAGGQHFQYEPWS